MNASLIDKVARFFAELTPAGESTVRNGLLPGPIVVAVSGGPDSVALLHALIAVRAPVADAPVPPSPLRGRGAGGEGPAPVADAPGSPPVPPSPLRGRGAGGEGPAPVADAPGSPPVPPSPLRGRGAGGEGAEPLLAIAHLNHLLRGEESDADEAFVRQMYQTLADSGVPRLELHCERLDVAEASQREQGNCESVARRLRYRWLHNLATRIGARWIATGHTADDQAETVLHRLIRGTGIKGLRGIAPRRSLDSVEIIRPMLTATRAEVLSFLDQQNQPFRQDSSNFDLSLTRNRIRHELLPSLARLYNPEIVRVLAQLAAQAEDLHRTIETLAGQLGSQAELPRAGPWLVFDSQPLAAAPRHLVREMFRLVWTREHWPESRMSFSCWDRLAAVALGEIAAADLPGRLQIRRQGRVVRLGPAQ